MKRLFSLIAAAVLAVPPHAFALPEGANVASGSASVERPDANTMRITTSDRAVINYDSFSIGSGQTVSFVQPSSSSTVLNRVTGADPSELLGSLYANGKVFLLNPNGIFFGPGCVIDTGSFMASTLAMSDADFLAGDYRFELGQGAVPAAIVNKGTIKVSPEGYTVLIAPLVSNEGVIIAQSGQVAIGGASQTTVNFDGKGLLNFAVSGLSSAPGTVLIPQGQATELIKSVVNCDTLVTAGDVVEENGVIKLVGAEGTAINSGTISVNGAGGKDAGSIVINSAQATVLASSGKLEAKGVGEASNGGFAEVSTLGRFSIGGAVDLTAQNGKTGTLLIDPYDVTIADANTSGSWSGGEFTPSGTATILITTLVDYLNAADVIVRTSGAGTDPGDIYVDADINYAGVNFRTLTLSADGGINLRNGGINFSDAGTLVLNANGGGIQVDRPITAGSMSMTSAGDITLNNNIAATAGDLSIVAGGAFLANTNRCLTGAGGGTTLGITGQNGLTLGGATLALGRKQLVQTGTGNVVLCSANGADITLGYNAISVDEGSLTANTGGADQGTIRSSFSDLNIEADGDVRLSGCGIGTAAAPIYISGDGSMDSTLTLEPGYGELGLTVMTDQFSLIDLTQGSVGAMSVTLPGGDAFSMAVGGEMYPQLTVDTHARNIAFTYTLNDNDQDQIDLLGLNTGTADASLSLTSGSLNGTGQVTANKLTLYANNGGIDLSNADNRISSLGTIEAYGGDVSISNNCPLSFTEYIYAEDADSNPARITIDNHDNFVDFPVEPGDGWEASELTITCSDIALTNAYFDYVDNKVVIKPSDPASSIGLGGNTGDSAAAFELDDTDIDALNYFGGNVEIGDPAGTGELLLGGDVYLSANSYVIHSGRANDGVNTIQGSDCNALLLDLNSNSGANTVRVSDGSGFAVDTTGGTSAANRSLTVISPDALMLGGEIYDSGLGESVYYGINTGTGDLTVNAFNSVDQYEYTRVLVSGLTTLTADGNDISLSEPENDFSTVTASAVNNLDLADANALDFGAITVGGQLQVSAAGAVTQSGDISAEALSMRTVNDAGASINLGRAGNSAQYIEFGVYDAAAVNAAAGDVTYAGSDGVEINGIRTAGDVSITAGGAVTQSSQIEAGSLTVRTKNDAGASITLDNPGNNANSISLASRNAADSANAAGVITYADADDVTITSIKTTGAASVKAGDAAAGSITFNGPVTAGSAVFEAGGSISNGTGGTADNVVTTGDASFKAHAGTAGTDAARLYVQLGGTLNVEAGGTSGPRSAYFIGLSSDNVAHLLADWATPGTVSFERRIAPAPAPAYTPQNKRQAESQTNSRIANEQAFFGPIRPGYLGAPLFDMPDVLQE